MGEARRLRNQPDDAVAALADLQRALGLDRPPAQTYRAIGLIQRQLDRRPEAAQAFRQYIAQARTAPDAAMIQSYLSELEP
jgi:regulator of sirC expression with transglutaminase-like and TPR domain